jgi:predicted NUDIX family phosphoesterase
MMLHYYYYNDDDDDDDDDDDGPVTYVLVMPDDYDIFIQMRMMETGCTCPRGSSIIGVGTILSISRQMDRHGDYMYQRRTRRYQLLVK